MDIVANGDNLPLEDDPVDLVISSHVLEHFYDPIKALLEWHRVVRDGGYIYAIVPHKERMFDIPRPRTTLTELILRHQEENPTTEDAHHSVWITRDVVELITYLGRRLYEVQDKDDKVGNGFTVVIKVSKGGHDAT